MEAQILVTMNLAEVNEATKTNQQNVQLRAYEESKPAGERKEYTDVVVPEKDNVKRPLILNPFDVKWMTVGDADLIFITLDNGQQFNLVNDKEIWDEIVAAIEAKSNKFKLENEY